MLKENWYGKVDRDGKREKEKAFSDCKLYMLIYVLIYAFIYINQVDFYCLTNNTGDKRI